MLSRIMSVITENRYNLLTQSKNLKLFLAQSVLDFLQDKENGQRTVK
jgi:predicted nucleic acid-binding protein